MNNVQRLAKAKALTARKFSAQHVNLDGMEYVLNTVPTGSMMLDYTLGIGGLPYGHLTEVFGANKLGKSSSIGYPTLANVQQQGKLPALICVEPRMVTEEDRQWARDLGLDPDLLLVQYPDTAEEAFEMLRDLVFEDLVDFIMIDSLGALGAESSAKIGGKKKSYGISGTVTDGLNAIMPRLWKNQQGLLIINQQRQTGSFNGSTLYESPGGEGLHHHARIRIQLKPGGERQTVLIDGESVVVGQDLICFLKKCNMSESEGKKAIFHFNNIRTSQYGFGIDKVQDVLNTAMVTGVFKGSSAYPEYPLFPATKAGNHQLHGKPAVAAFLAEHPDAVEAIRQDVMRVMLEQELAAQKRKKAK